MAAPSVYYPHAIIFPDATTITQFDKLEPENNYADLTEYSASDVMPLYTGSHSAAPQLRFKTPQIKKFLDHIDVDSVCGDESSGNLDIMYRAGTNKGTRVATITTSHLRARMTSNAWIALESISAKDGELAELDGRIQPVWDESNNPIIWTAGVANAGTAAAGDLFGLGPIKLQGSFIEGVMGWDLNLNLEYEEIRGDGKGFPVYLAVKRARPVLSFDTTDRAVMATYGAAGTALSGLSFFLRKKAISGINVANATEEHIEFTAQSGTIKADSAAGRVMIHLRELTFDTTAAID